MKWYLNKRKFMPKALKIVTYPWHFKMFIQFAHPVSRVSSLTVVFPQQICLNLLGGVWGHLCLPKCLSPPGMVKNFLCRKRVLLRWLASHLHSFGKHPVSITTSLDAP